MNHGDPTGRHPQPNLWPPAAPYLVDVLFLERVAQAAAPVFGLNRPLWGLTTVSYSFTVREGRNVEFEISYRSPSLRLVISASRAWRPLAPLPDPQIHAVARFLPGELGLLPDPQEQPGLAGYEQGEGDGATLTRLAYSSAIDGRLGVIDAQPGTDSWHALVYPATTNRMRSLIRHVVAMNDRADVLARHAGELRESFQHLH